MWDTRRSTLDKATNTGIEQAYNKNGENGIVRIIRDNKHNIRRLPGGRLKRWIVNWTSLFQQKMLKHACKRLKAKKEEENGMNYMNEIYFSDNVSKCHCYFSFVLITSQTLR